MTLALAVVFVALLMIYCGVKGRSFRHALTGKSVVGGQGSLLADATASTASSTAAGSSSAGASTTSQPGTSGASRGEGGPHR